MRHSFNLHDVDYIHVIASAIREEMGKALRREREKKGLRIDDISAASGVSPLLVYGVESNNGHHSWRCLRYVLDKCGYEGRVYITFDIQTKFTEKSLK